MRVGGWLADRVSRSCQHSGCAQVPLTVPGTAEISQEAAETKVWRLHAAGSESASEPNSLFLQFPCVP